jgi:hypothetical protein
LTIRMSSQTSPVAEPTYTELRAEWDAAWQEWTASATCAELTATLRGAKRMPRRVRNVVCFGLGGLAPDRGVMQERGGDGDGDGESHGHGHGHDRAARRCMAQHAAAITIAEVLRERLGLCERPAILAQEPAYYDADIQLLGELGIKVVTGAGGLGFTHVDNESVVMSCHPNIPVKQVVADIARPALMVWNKVQPVEEETDQWRRGDGQSMIA